MNGVSKKKQNGRTNQIQTAMRFKRESETYALEELLEGRAGGGRGRGRGLGHLAAIIVNVGRNNNCGLVAGRSLDRAMAEAKFLELLLQLLGQRRRVAGRRAVGVGVGRGAVAVVMAVTIAIRGGRGGGGVVGGGSVAVVVSKILDGALGGVGRDKGGTLRDGRASGDLDLVLVGNLLDNLCNLAAVGEDGGNPLLVHDGFTDLLRLRHCSGC